MLHSSYALGLQCRESVTGVCAACTSRATSPPRPLAPLQKAAKRSGEKLNDCVSKLDANKSQWCFLIAAVATPSENVADYDKREWSAK